MFIDCKKANKNIMFLLKLILIANAEISFQNVDIKHFLRLFWNTKGRNSLKHLIKPTIDLCLQKKGQIYKITFFSSLECAELTENKLSRTIEKLQIKFFFVIGIELTVLTDVSKLNWHLQFLCLILDKYVHFTYCLNFLFKSLIDTKDFHCHRNINKTKFSIFELKTNVIMLKP